MTNHPSPVYAIGLVTIKDRGKYAAYEKDFWAVLEPFGGKILSVENSARIVEGKWPCSRTVILWFPSGQAVRSWYDSEPYQKLVRLRAGIADVAIAILSARQ